MLPRIIILAVMSVLTVEAQSYVTFTVGQLQCGAVQRSANTAQSYCYGPKLVLVHNTLETLVDEAQGGNLAGTALITTVQWEGDFVSWQFDLRDGVITYQISGNQQPIMQGQFSGPLAVGPSGPGCPIKGQGNPEFTWTNDTQSCTAVWSASDGAWLQCCGGLA